MTEKCEGLPAFRYTWPGYDEHYACFSHAMRLLEVAKALGFHLQMIPLDGDDFARLIDDDNFHCAQNVKGDGE